MTKCRGRLPLALVALACASGDAAGPAPETAGAGELVELRFAWPQALLAEVDAHVVTQDRGSVGYRFDLRAETADDGLWLRHGGFRIEDPATAGDFVDVASGGAGAGLIAGLEPDFLVDRAGVFQRVDPRAASTLADEALARRTAGAGSRDAQVRELAARAIAGRQAQRAQELWYALVEFWAGQAFELETDYELSIEQGLEDRPALTEDFVGALQVSGWLPCPSRGAGKRCVELTLESRLADPDPSKLAARVGLGARELGIDTLAPDVLQQLESGSFAELVSEYDQRETIRLLCEPDGLIPHELAHRVERRLELQVPGHGSERHDRVRETAYRFRYSD